MFYLFFWRSYSLINFFKNNKNINVKIVLINTKKNIFFLIIKKIVFFKLIYTIFKNLLIKKNGF